jgi:PAS domain S-box-containing protein
VGQQVFALLDQVYATGKAVFLPELEVLLPHSAPSGAAPLFVNACYLPLRDGQGHLYGVLDFSYDVTEQVLARRQVQQLNQELEVRVAERTRELVETQAAALAAAQRQVQQREDLYQIFEQAPAAIVLLREPNHRIEYVNPAYQQLFPELALRGRLLTEAYPTAATSGILARLDQVFATGEPYVGVERPMELTLTPGQPPQTRYFNYTYQPYREQGRIVGVSLFAYDVTEAALTRAQAARQARQFQELYEQAPMAVCILRGPEFIVELANPAILHIWGLSAGESLGRPRLELIPETSRASLRTVLETAYHTHQTHHVQEFPVVLGRSHTGQPDIGYFNFIYQPLFDAQGQPVALTCVGIEVTEQVLARQQVEQLNQELEARVQARTREVQAAQAATERERTLLQALFAQAPVAIGLFQGEELRLNSKSLGLYTRAGSRPAAAGRGARAAWSGLRKTITAGAHDAGSLHRHRNARDHAA